MALSKEYILTLSLLKEVGVKGIGPKKILSIAESANNQNQTIDSLESLFITMSHMKEKVINKVSLFDLEEAFEMANRIINSSKSHQIFLLGFYEDDFPEILRHTINEEGKLDPPLLLWYRGDLSVLKLPGIAIIGTREVTPKGVIGGEYLSGEFAKRGFNIISGLAIGCDTCGHRGALRVKGRTTAILANGLDTNSIYPTDNKDLAEEIVQKGGLLLSEYRINTPVNKFSLVARDRLQAGLAMGTLVIQTGIEGGTMHAANTTLKAGKPLYTMLFSDELTNEHEKCKGNAYLVSMGAKYITGHDDLDKVCENIKSNRNIKNSLFD